MEIEAKQDYALVRTSILNDSIRPKSLKKVFLLVGPEGENPVDTFNAVVTHSTNQSAACCAVAGKSAMKRNRYVRLTAASKSVNRTLEAKNRDLAGIKGYVTNLPDPDAQQVISTYSQLLNVEKSFRMSSPTSRPGRSTTTPESRSRRT
jgi:hypothetical protein